MNSLLKEVSRRIQIKKGTERDKHEVLVPPLRMIRSTASFHAYLRLNKQEKKGNGPEKQQLQNVYLTYQLNSKH